MQIVVIFEVKMDFVKAGRTSAVTVDGGIYR